MTFYEEWGFKVYALTYDELLDLVDHARNNRSKLKVFPNRNETRNICHKTWNVVVREEMKGKMVKRVTLRCLVNCVRIEGEYIITEKKPIYLQIDTYGNRFALDKKRAIDFFDLDNDQKL